VIEIESETLQRIREAAEAAFPEECCGLLIGRDLGGGNRRIERVVASPNVAADDRHQRFEIDPQIRFDTMRALRGGPARILGHYHSHPGHPALPSASDLAQAWEPDLVWLITAVAGGCATETRAHVINSATGKFSEVALPCIDPEA
jgi:proteasome lid subunit RPN8/RPN11